MMARSRGSEVSGSRNKWRQQMVMFGALVAAASAFGTMAMSHNVAAATHRGSLHGITIVGWPPDDHPIGFGANITPISVERPKYSNDARPSAFLVDYPPGASAVLHRLPSSGYVLVRVVSGTIRASAWHAGIGPYHAGETWVEPAFAFNITAANSSAGRSA